MDSLRAFVAQKKKEKEEEFEGKKCVRRGEIVEKRLKRLRDAEEKEMQLKVCPFLKHSRFLTRLGVQRTKSGEVTSRQAETAAETDDNHVRSCKISHGRVVRRF